MTDQNERFKKLKYGYDSDSEVVSTSLPILKVELGLNRQQQVKALKMILLNFKFSDCPKVGVLVSTSIKLTKRANFNEIGQRALNTVIDKLAEYEYISRQKGSKKDKRCTLIWPTPKLNSFFHDNRWFMWTEYGNNAPLELITNHEPIVLKDSNKDKTPIEYEDTSYTNRVRQNMKRYEEFLSNKEITYGGYREHKDGLKTISPPYDLKRSYNNGSFGFGGRLSSPWANLPSALRETIQIDGNDTVEIDFSASSLNIIYRAVTGKPYQGGDAYMVNVDGVDIPRSYSKRYLAIAQNVSSPQVASRIFKIELVSDEIFDDFTSYGVSVKKLALALRAKHKEIGSCLFKGELGLRVQLAESEIVFMISNRLTLEDIPVLTVYDSFIMEERHKEHVEEVIADTLDSCIDDYLNTLSSYM